MKQEKIQLPKWYGYFLQFYRLPQKPSIQAAYQMMRENWLPEYGKLPDLAEVEHYFLNLGLKK